MKKENSVKQLAALIGAAPEMLEVLMEVYSFEFVAGHTGTDLWFDQLEALLDKVERAIENAKGKCP